jgi:hypothetical protein
MDKLSVKRHLQFTKNLLKKGRLSAIEPDTDFALVENEKVSDEELRHLIELDASEFEEIIIDKFLND